MYSTVKQPPATAAPLVLSDSGLQASDEEMDPPSGDDNDEDAEWQAKPRESLQQSRCKPTRRKLTRLLRDRKGKEAEDQEQAQEVGSVAQSVHTDASGCTSSGE